VYIRIGPPGTGKRAGGSMNNGSKPPDNSGKWFNGCELADILVFNDVCLGAVSPLDIFKKLTDRYPFRGAVKGGFTWLKPKVIAFTSNRHPYEWCPGISEFDKAAIERRMTEITVVK